MAVTPSPEPGSDDNRYFLCFSIESVGVEEEDEMTRFQDEWLLDPNLKEWVVKVTNDESKVYCRWCSIVLRAHRSDLTGHSNTQKHAKNAATASVTGANTGPISVQIVQQDPPPEARLQSPKKMEKDPMFGSISTSANSTPNRPQYTKRYRKEWEDLDELKSWLRPYESDNSKAYCRFCNCVLRAHRHDLVLHAKSSRHKRTEYTRQNGHVMNTQIISSDGEMDVSAADSNDHDLSELDHSHGKRARLDDVNTIEHIEIPGCAENADEHFGQISIMTTTSDDGKHQDINVIKVEKADGSYNLSHIDPGSLSIQTVPMRRRKLNASKVIAAIQNNEFTGYELLQIVKCAVPRL